jgi:transaldolase
LIFSATTGDKSPEVSIYVNDEAAFRWALFGEEMAWDKLHEGIQKFAEDAETLKAGKTPKVKRSESMSHVFFFLLFAW